MSMRPCLVDERYHTSKCREDRLYEYNVHLVGIWIIHSEHNVESTLRENQSSAPTKYRGLGSTIIAKSLSVNMSYQNSTDLIM